MINEVIGVSQEWAVIRKPLKFDSFNDVSWLIDVQWFSLHVTHCFAIEHILVQAVFESAIEQCACVRVCVCTRVFFFHFSWLAFLRRACLVTMSVHLRQQAYLKCFKRLLSVLFVITRWTTFSGTCTQAGRGHTHRPGHLLTRTPQVACKPLLCMLSHTQRKRNAWGKKNKGRLPVQHMTKIENIQSFF